MYIFVSLIKKQMTDQQWSQHQMLHKREEIWKKTTFHIGDGKCVNIYEKY